MATKWIPILNGMGGVEESSGLEGHIFVSRGIPTPSGPDPDKWHTFDVTKIGIPKDAVCVDINGILIITPGALYDAWPGICVAFKDPRNTSATIRGNYAFQSMGNTNRGGDRTNASTTVTLHNGTFNWGWWYNDYPLGWPNYPSIGFNLTITRWFK